GRGGRGRTAGRAQDLQAVYRGQVPQDRVGPVLPGQRRQGQAMGERLPGVAQGRARRGAGGPQGPAGLGRGDRLQPRAGAVPGGRDARGPAEAVHDGGAQGGGRGRRAAAETVDKAVDRWVWYAGWADKLAQVFG